MTSTNYIKQNKGLIPKFHLNYTDLYSETNNPTSAVMCLTFPHLLVIVNTKQGSRMIGPV